MSSSEASSSVCPFFKLPAELRITIYNYALQASHGVVCKPVSTHGVQVFQHFPLLEPVKNTGSPEVICQDEAQPIVSSTTELNQLKYVCRQLYTETKNITIPSTEVIFEHGAKSFLAFVQACPQATLSKLSIVTILEKESAPVKPHREGFCESEALCSLVKFCETFPSTTVRVRHPWLHPANMIFSGRASELDIGLRNDTSIAKRFAPYPGSEASDIAFVKRPTSPWVVTSTNKVPRNYPDKLRAYPSYACLDVEGFKTERDDRPWLLELRPGQLEDALATTMEIFKKGI